MKKTAIGFFLGLVVCSCLAAVVYQTTGIYILNSVDEVKFSARVTGKAQTFPWMEFADTNGTVFAVPASGVIAVANGGTGGATAAAAKTALGIQTGTATSAADGTVTNTFATAFSSAPKVVVVQTGDATTVTNSVTITTTNFIWNTGGKASQACTWIAIGAP